MATRKVKMIINPNADLGRAWRQAADLRPVVEQYGGADWAGTVYPTHAIELARQAAEEGYELVISVGGDGTVHEVINGLMQAQDVHRPRLGIVPMGTGNDFAYSLGIEPKPAEAVQRIFTGQPRRVDIGRLVDNTGRVEYWDNALGIGFDATTTIHSRRYTLLHGFPAYFLAVLQTVMLNHDAPRMHITTDSEQWTQEILMFVLCNGSREGGGFSVAPDAKPDDGILDYASIGRVSRLMMLRLIPEVLRGTHGRFSQVRMGKLSRMELQADSPLTIHTDGEIFSGFGMDVRQLSVEILPGALEIIA
jgi:YegS/Rv2252/BmrU family lipid kinase